MKKHSIGFKNPQFLLKNRQICEVKLTEVQKKEFRVIEMKIEKTIILVEKSKHHEIIRMISKLLQFEIQLQQGIMSNN